MTIAKDIMKFISKYSAIKQIGQGNITISCEALWNMSDEQFKKRFIDNNASPSDNSDFKATPKPCPQCDGSGEIQDSIIDTVKRKCLVCKGTGKAS